MLGKQLGKLYCCGKFANLTGLVDYRIFESLVSQYASSSLYRKPRLPQNCSTTSMLTHRQGILFEASWSWLAQKCSTYLAACQTLALLRACTQSTCTCLKETSSSIWLLCTAEAPVRKCAESHAEKLAVQLEHLGAFRAWELG